MSYLKSRHFLNTSHRLQILNLIVHKHFLIVHKHFDDVNFIQFTKTSWEVRKP